MAKRSGGFEKLPRGVNVTGLDGFAEGNFIIQDPATALAVELMDVKPGEKALDYCAAPGGKTVQLAWRGAEVTASEVNPRRFRRLQENVERCGVGDRVRTVCGKPSPDLYAKVLVDAPCSNSGVLRRRPDARWNWSLQKVHSLAVLQFEILASAAQYVAPGGTLVYSTCSNEPEENGGKADFEDETCETRQFLSTYFTGLKIRKSKGYGAYELTVPKEWVEMYKTHGEDWHASHAVLDTLEAYASSAAFMFGVITLDELKEIMRHYDKGYCLPDADLPRILSARALCPNMPFRIIGDHLVANCYFPEDEKDSDAVRDFQLAVRKQFPRWLPPTREDFFESQFGNAARIRAAFLGEELRNAA